MSRLPGQPGFRSRATKFRKAVWWLIRKNKTLTIADIMTTLCDGNEKNAWNALSQFMRALAGVGVLEEAQERRADGKPTSNGLKVYTLARDLGPECPVLRMNKRDIFDPNTGELLTPLPGKRPRRARGALLHEEAAT